MDSVIIFFIWNLLEENVNDSRLLFELLLVIVLYCMSHSSILTSITSRLPSVSKHLSSVSG